MNYECTESGVKCVQRVGFAGLSDDELVGKAETEVGSVVAAYAALKEPLADFVAERKLK